MVPREACIEVALQLDFSERLISQIRAADDPLGCLCGFIVDFMGSDDDDDEDCG